MADNRDEDVALRQPMSLQAFLAWEERQELRHEFDGFRPVAMTGDTLATQRSRVTWRFPVGGRLRGTSCRFLGSDTKNREYAALPSVRCYVMLEQERIGATVFTRTGDGWVGHILADDVILAMPEIGIELPLAELYDGLGFSISDAATDEVSAR